MSSKQNLAEFTWHFDTSARDSSQDALRGAQDDNPTIDVLMPCDWSQHRLPMQEVFVGSVEIPTTQRNVEWAWNRLYFDHGFAVRVDPDATDLNPCARQFTVSGGGTAATTATLPL